MRIFVDTNVLIDWILNRSEFHLDAERLMSAIVNGVVDGYVSSHSLTDLFYITRKNLTLEKRRILTLFVLANMKVIPESQVMFDNVLNQTPFQDLEDGLQQQCASVSNLDFVVTQNLKDFQNTKVKAISIKDALHLLN